MPNAIVTWISKVLTYDPHILKVIVVYASTALMLFDSVECHWNAHLLTGTDSSHIRHGDE